MGFFQFYYLVIKLQIEKRQLLLDEIQKMQSNNELILKKINILENQIYDPKYVNQISALTRENVKLRRDTRILSSQVDLFVLAQKQTQKNKSDSSIETRPTNLINFYQPGSSNQNIAQLLNLHQNNNLLALRLPPSEQIRLQPNHVSSNENINVSPPIPPRPKNWPPTPHHHHHHTNRHPSRSPPPPPKPTRNLNPDKTPELNNENNDPRWHCPRCTFANDENLNECEVCHLQLSSSSSSPSLNRISNEGSLNDSRHIKWEKKWCKRK